MRGTHRIPKAFRAKMRGRHPLCFAEARPPYVRTSPFERTLGVRTRPRVALAWDDGSLRLIGFPVGA